MTMPSKGTRTIRVGESTYRWRVSRRATGYTRESVAMAPVMHLRLRLIVEASSGARLSAEFDGMLAIAVPSAGFDDVQDIRITPGMVREVIEHALGPGGWSPTNPCSAVALGDTLQGVLGSSLHSDITTLDRSYDPCRIGEYLKGARALWTREH